MKHIREKLESLRKDELINMVEELEKRVSQYEEHFLTREEVAARYKKSPSWVDKCRAAGILKPLKHDPHKANSSVVYPLSILIEYEQARICR